MTNFIFKSQGTYKKLVNKLEIIQTELRHARVDHAKILMMLEKLTTDDALQSQVDEYFDEEKRATAGLDPNDRQDLD